MRIAFDTNIISYVAGVKRASADPAKIVLARQVVSKLAHDNDLIVATQVLGELYNVLVRGSIERLEARDIVDVFVRRYVIVESNLACFRTAIDIATDHKLQIWDALIIATSAAAGCTLLLSEDMQDGFTTHGITIANPVADRPIAKLAGLLI